MSTAVSRVDFSVKNALSDTALRATTAKRLLADIREMAPEITARAAEIEAARRVPVPTENFIRSGLRPWIG